MNRKTTLKRPNGLLPQIETHMQKLRRHPRSRDVPHWRVEVESWIRQIEELLPALGRKTSREWNQRIEQWQLELGE